MIRVHQAQHGGLVFDIMPTRRQKTFRQRLAAVAVIAAVAVSAAVLQGFLASSSTPAPSPAWRVLSTSQ